MAYNSVQRANDPDLIKIFISYSQEDINIAQKTKLILEQCNFKPFLAYEMPKGTHWKSNITNNLRSCDVFLPIVSQNFERSMWANQEAGFAFALNKFIFPVMVNSKPPGFISDFQAHPLHNLEIQDSTNFSFDFIKSLIENRNMDKKIKKNLLKNFQNPPTHLTYEQMLNLFSDCIFFNKNDFNTLLKISLNNPQLLEDQNTRIILKRLIETNSDKLDQKVANKFFSEYQRTERKSKANKNLVTISYEKFTNNIKDQVHISLRNVKTFSNFLDLVYFAQPGKIFGAYTDGIDWELVDRSSEIPFTPVRKILGEESGYRIEDKRTIKDVGIKKGMILDVVPLKGG